MKLLVKFLVFCAAIYTSYCLCNVCSSITNLACVDNDKFSVCVDGLPSTTVTQCPTGTVCTSTAVVCSAQGTISGSCSRCGICDSNNIFACTSYNTFALCYGTATPSSVNIACSGTLACNIDDPRICVDPQTTGMGATCPSAATTTSTTTTTTVSPNINPQAYCSAVATIGRFEVANDPNCKEYIFCIFYNSTWIGNIYECPGSTYFDSTSRLCGVTIPQRCA